MQRRCTVLRWFSKLICLGITGLLSLPTQVASAQSGLIYAATSNGIFKSTDGGTSWASANTGLSGINAFSLAIDPSNPATLYAGTLGNRVYKSADGGQNWTVSSAGLADS